MRLQHWKCWQSSPACGSAPGLLIFARQQLRASVKTEAQAAAFV